MRIITGKFKGKKLFLPNDKNTRPLKDLVKESIFNLITHSKKINLHIENSVVLDLFAGSGSFGLECISRGSKQVIFFENYPEALKVLKKNIQSLKISDYYKIIEHDCFDYFNTKNSLKIRFDIIFIDPPYKEIKINEIIDQIIKQSLLRKNGVIIIHRHKKDKIDISKKLAIFEDRKYGISRVFFAN